MRTRDLPRFDKLQELADLLRRLPRKRFDYSTFVDLDTWKGSCDLSCGTTACALGWSTTIFPRLKLQQTDENNIDCYLSRGDVVFNCGGTIYENGLAAAKYFRISNDEASGLFYPSGAYYEERADWGVNGESPQNNATPKEVARHIERFIKWKKKQLKLS